ncbi:hypothetical protein FEM48_Zijuj04G0193900 [Ziziphus jujuba var. spinosa]|uniref:Uncharacterized protein n=1 Tax=Ziziphus jujuba var. spinosa TaxID=714518 RepID=A0A978VLQ6_ZIZJJ|nr:hypothetical protein FEM48_Zijuj04G0193900 [Ziziphus jujuba var. spinosa]
MENPTPPSSQSQPQAQPDSANVVRRYAPPNQRNRSLNRRKSADRFDRSSFYGNDLEKNQVSASKNVPVADHGDAESNSLLNENPYARLIALEGCSSSEASQLLSKRWEAAMQALNDPSIDLSDRPVLYSGSGASAWANFRYPHQFMVAADSAGSPGSQIDFLAELRHKMTNANANFDA